MYWLDGTSGYIWHSGYSVYSVGFSLCLVDLNYEYWFWFWLTVEQISEVKHENWMSRLIWIQSENLVLYICIPKYIVLLRLSLFIIVDVGDGVVVLVIDDDDDDGPLRWRNNGRVGVSNHQSHECLLKLLFRHRSKKTSNHRVTGLFAGNSPVTGEFPAQMASNTENVSIWWRRHASFCRQH